MNFHLVLKRHFILMLKNSCVNIFVETVILFPGYRRTLMKGKFKRTFEIKIVCNIINALSLTSVE